MNVCKECARQYGMSSISRVKTYQRCEYCREITGCNSVMMVEDLKEQPQKTPIFDSSPIFVNATQQLENKDDSLDAFFESINRSIKSDPRFLLSI